MAKLTPKRALIAVLRIAVLFYAIAGGALYFFQEKLIFHPAPLPAAFRFDLRLPFEERTVMSGGEKVHGLLVHAPRSIGLLVHFHGNAGNLDDWSEVAEELAARLHWDVWMIDYPGSGKSTGEIRSEEQLHALADDVFTAARAEAKGRPLAVMGRSIGTGLAVRLAARNDVAVLVLETPYYSLRDLARKFYPWAPTFLLRYPLDSFRWIPEVKAPVLILHGNEDELIPFEQGRSLAALRPGSRFVEIPGGHHNDLRHHPEYWRELEAFFPGPRTAAAR